MTWVSASMTAMALRPPRSPRTMSYALAIAASTLAGTASMSNGCAMPPLPYSPHLHPQDTVIELLRLLEISHLEDHVSDSLDRHVTPPAVAIGSLQRRAGLALGVGRARSPSVASRDASQYTRRRLHASGVQRRPVV